MKQTTSHVLMVRPATFRMNEQTAVNNYFMHESDESLVETVNHAIEEFDRFVDVLRLAGVHVYVYQDTTERDTPDSVFPNNWISFHEDGTAVLYPMFAENRRDERREEVVLMLEEEGFLIHEVVDYSSAELSAVFLEGTGSLVLDRPNERAYCALSDRAHEELLIEFCEDMGFWPVSFRAYQTVGEERLPIYHTNVMLSVGTHIAVACFDSVDDPAERKNLRKHLQETGKTIVAINEDQLIHFAGNMLEVQGYKGNPIMAMSSSAYDSLTEFQRSQIREVAEIVHSPLPTIENLGGGSARCMMAEIFLPRVEAGELRE